MTEQCKGFRSSLAWMFCCVWLFAVLVDVVRAEDEAALTGGETTVFETGPNAFARPLANITRETRRLHAVGNSFFNKNWVAAPASTGSRDGLGPLFNAKSCSACHFKDGRGRPPLPGESMPAMVYRLGDASGKPHAGYGGQFSDCALPGMESEGDVVIWGKPLTGKYADGDAWKLTRPVYELQVAEKPYGKLGEHTMSPRVSPALHGLGLLEAIPEKTILALADPEDADGDGISGRANRVMDVATKKKMLGRFGWKANQPTIEQQSAAAFNNDLGLTTNLFPVENQTPVQRAAAKGFPNGGAPEVSDKILSRVVAYLQTLAPPARRGWDGVEVKRGEKLFYEAKCAACHVPEMQTGTSHALHELRGQTVRAYTDLLLHDMGEALADGKPDGEATGREWRTPPLWGLGLLQTVNGHTRLMHDGRADGFEEAILWHGGEAEGSKGAFLKMGASDRAALVAFLKSL